MRKQTERRTKLVCFRVSVQEADRLKKFLPKRGRAKLIRDYINSLISIYEQGQEKPKDTL